MRTYEAHDAMTCEILLARRFFRKGYTLRGANDTRTWQYQRLCDVFALYTQQMQATANHPHLARRFIICECSNGNTGLFYSQAELAACSRGCGYNTINGVCDGCSAIYSIADYWRTFDNQDDYRRAIQALLYTGVHY